MAILRSACPLNCPDSCGFIVEYSEDKGLRVQGDKEHPLTKGFICSKAQAQAQWVFSAERLRFPLLKDQGTFRRISWDEAYTLLVDKIRETLKEVGSWGILHHYDYGHNGTLRELDRRFFQALGGVTEPRGSMCWGAGLRAQEIDFGGAYANDWAQVTQAKLIILWGRDPAVTNLHMVPFLLEAKKAGATILVINPVRVKSGDFAQDYIQVNPGSDGVLAMGIAHIILREGWLNWEFVRQSVHGLEAFALRAKEYEPERVAQLTGVSVEKQEELAYKISHMGPMTILSGYGLQRYSGGGNTLRAIDALIALTGNIGKPGAGIQYGYLYHRGYLNHVKLDSSRYQSRTFPHSFFAEEIEKAHPPVQLAVVTRSNPLVQQPNSLLWREVWREIPFKVTFDTTLTETARQSDLVLPVTTAFEDEDLIATSWSPILQLTQKIVEPQGEARSEALVFTELAQRLGLGDDFSYTPEQWLDYVLSPLNRYGITLESLRQGPIRAPYIPEVAWSDLQFKTPSGKIELASEIALAVYGDAVADPLLSHSKEDLQRHQEFSKTQNQSEYPWYLITPHPHHALHSQFQETEDFHLYIHPQLAEKYYLSTGDRALVETEHGQLLAWVSVSEDVHPQAVVIPEGGAVDGFGVNQLLIGKPSDFGESTPYYEARCQLRKWLVD
ncbi:anaerobic dehydrogenase, typically selenocysteine-containing [Desulfitobacterium dichloroeliminans LMG P-21439]|uniref:Anaerobic dehydrogenase, typically selenocysteine-containing n=1 Tax=Desulfitobacterium dichloroeliminans (strain LMG P-21439 / DCA1) TaxID=871963 RepID=L0FCZ8_DESDL|nr:molybdopterin-dependent oxidoreductase [Desulfitobacterium dichloroeliminans]AGA70880.1 anaerobic dehydrogenase, typically selenocysteine-containing [Desulfitobacterium dichloroeliminans LMG P-21439]